MEETSVTIGSLNQTWINPSMPNTTSYHQIQKNGTVHCEIPGVG